MPERALFGKNNNGIPHNKRESKIKEMLEIMIDNGADINAIDPQGWAPIHHAVSRGFIDTVIMLIKKGADINLKDQIYESNMTPLDWAIREESEEITELLRKHGAKTSRELEEDYKTIKFNAH